MMLFSCIHNKQLKDEEPSNFLNALDQPEHKALATTMDNGGTCTMGTAGMLMTKEKIMECLQKTVNYYLFTRTSDSLNQ